MCQNVLSLLGRQAKAGAKVVGRKKTLTIAWAGVLVAAKWPQPYSPLCLSQTWGESKLLPKCEVSNCSLFPWHLSLRRHVRPLLDLLSNSAFPVFPSHTWSSPGLTTPLQERNTKFCLQQCPRESRDYQNLTNMAGRARCIFTSTCLLRNKYLAAHVFKNHTATTLLPWGDKEDKTSLWQMLALLLKALLNGTCKTGDCHSTKTNIAEKN